jgi:hypothetical protein
VAESVIIPIKPGGGSSTELPPLSGWPWAEEVDAAGFPTDGKTPAPAPTQGPPDPLNGASWVKSIGAVVDTVTKLGGFGALPKAVADVTGITPGSAATAGVDAAQSVSDFFNGGWRAYVWYFVFALALIALVFFGTMQLVRA